VNPIQEYIPAYSNFHKTPQSLQLSPILDLKIFNTIAKTCQSIMIEHSRILEFHFSALKKSNIRNAQTGYRTNIGNVINRLKVVI